MFFTSFNGCYLLKMDIFLHNLSHADLLLGVVPPAGYSEDGNIVVVRPKFTKFHSISKSLFDHITQHLNRIKIFSSPMHDRRIQNNNDDDLPSVSVGFDLRDVPGLCDIRDVRFRKEIIIPNGNDSDESRHCAVHFVYFPLLSVLLHRWLLHTSFSQLNLILVSGKGQPIDQFSQGVDNSTQFAGHLIEVFVKHTSEYMHLDVHLIHSETNLFRYDENILFVKRELLPVIHEMRRQIVAKKKDKWRDFMRMTLSFADGSSARISAINQSLKIYQPSYMHFWSLKSFWREQRIYDDDVEYHTYEAIATEPAMRLKDLTDPLVLKAVEEIDRFHQEFEAVAASSNNDLRSFWFRKTMKAVLAVLIVEKPSGEIVAIRGTNLEVSLPTGSLCAERNAIGTAFATDMSLKREDIKLVAVYSAAYEEKHKKPAAMAKREVSILASGELREKSHSLSLTTTSSNRKPLEISIATTTTATTRDEAEGASALNSARSTRPAVLTNTARVRAILQINDPSAGASTTGTINTSLSPSRAFGSPLSPSESNSSSSNAKRSLDQMSSPLAKAAANAAVRESSSSSSSSFKTAANLLEEAATSLLLEEEEEENKDDNEDHEDEEEQAALSSRQPSRKKRKVVPFSFPDSFPASRSTSTQNLRGYSMSLLGSHHHSSSQQDLLQLQQTATADVNDAVDGGDGAAAANYCVSSAVDAAAFLLGDPYSHCLATMETIETGENDLNPLKPCGACTSWLKKIVKCNPDFRVVTFTDARRQGIYVEYMQE